MEDTTRHSVFSDGILNFVSAGRDSDRPLPKLLLGLSVIVLIACMFPHGGQREITYRVGTVWVDEDLISPFPFPIYRDAVGYDKDRQNAGRDFYPVFERAEGVPAAVQQALEARLRVLPGVAGARERMLRSHLRQDITIPNGSSHWGGKRNPLARPTSRMSWSWGNRSMWLTLSSSMWGEISSKKYFSLHGK